MHESNAATSAPITSLYLGLFGRAPDAEGYQHWLKVLSQAASFNVGVLSLENSFASSTEFQNLFGNLGANQAIDRIYSNVFGRQADTAGKEYWLTQLNTGKTISEVAFAVVNAALEQQNTSDASLAHNKLAISNYLIENLHSNDPFLAQQVFSVITANPESVIQTEAILTGITSFVATETGATFLSLEEAGATKLGNAYTVSLGNHSLIDNTNLAGATVNVHMGSGSDFVGLGGQRATGTYNIDAQGGKEYRIFEVGAAGDAFPNPSYIIEHISSGDVISFSNLFNVHNEPLIVVPLDAAKSQTEAIQILQHAASPTHRIVYGLYQGSTYVLAMGGDKTEANETSIIELKGYHGPLTLSFKDAARHTLASEAYLTIGSVSRNNITIDTQLSGNASVSFSDNFNHIISDTSSGEKHITVNGNADSAVTLTHGANNSTIELGTQQDSTNVVNLSGLSGLFTNISGHNLSLNVGPSSDPALTTSIYKLSGVHKLINNENSSLSIGQIITDAKSVEIINHASEPLIISRPIEVTDAETIIIGDNVQVSKLIVDHDQSVNITAANQNLDIRTGSGNDVIKLGSGSYTVDAGYGVNTITFDSHPGKQDTVIVSARIGQDQVLLSGFNVDTDLIAFDVNRITTDGTHGLIQSHFDASRTLIPERIAPGTPSKLFYWDKVWIGDSIEATSNLTEIFIEDETTIPEMIDWFTRSWNPRDITLGYEGHLAEPGSAFLVEYKSAIDHTIHIAAVWTNGGFSTKENGIHGMYDIVLTGQSSHLSANNFKFV